MAYCARHAPGLTPSELAGMTRAETDHVRRHVGEAVKAEQEVSLLMFKTLLKQIANVGGRL